ncbi:MAG: DUF4435 domain-containing protein [Planctomycetota bacterium]|nr:DUF4435 domain-containing protein [Planctomycetota bacterium]
MGNEPRFQINELVSLYKLHPEFRDIFAEGPRDRNFYGWFLNKVGAGRDAHCYDIGCVDIPSDVLAKHNLSPGCEKNKVIALALELDENLPKDSKKITCIVDADFDYLFETFVNCELLLYTDYTGLEMYTLKSEVLTKFLAVGTSGFPISADKIIKEVTKILVDLFLVRATNISLDLGIEWLEIKGKRYAFDTEGKIHFDIESFVAGYLSKSNLANEQERFWKQFKKLKERVSGDIRRFIRGHDYVELLGVYLYRVKRKLRKWKESPENLTGTLLGCLETIDLCKESLFRAIVSRINQN